jgi:hypothetical protein
MLMGVGTALVVQTGVCLKEPQKKHMHYCKKHRYSNMSGLYVIKVTFLACETQCWLVVRR